MPSTPLSSLKRPGAPAYSLTRSAPSVHDLLDPSRSFLLASSHAHLAPSLAPALPNLAIRHTYLLGSGAPSNPVLAALALGSVSLSSSSVRISYALPFATITPSLQNLECTMGQRHLPYRHRQHKVHEPVHEAG